MRRTNTQLKLILVYEIPRGEMTIGEIKDPVMLAEAKQAVFEAAEAELCVLGKLDPVLRIDKECELRRKRRILNRLKNVVNPAIVRQ
jgi:hypothetical protein